MKLLELFVQGGFIMYPLLVFSILAWSIGLYKMHFLWLFSKEYRQVYADVRKDVVSGKVQDLSKLTNGTSSHLIKNPVLVAAAEQHANRDELNERLWRSLAHTNTEIKSSLWILGSISSSAPFIGLFGTVLGIMESFKAIGSSGKSGFSIVAAGISESLVATAAGIIVAVVALLFYNYLQTRANGIAQDMRLKLEEIGDIRLSPAREMR